MKTRETQIRAEPARRADPAGNERLTAMTGAVLLVLFAAECLTLLNIGNLLTLHVFLGMLLLGPAGLKTGSTLWRFTRYYTGAAAYVRKGPPAPLQRVTGPFVILTTVAVLGTGIMLAVEGPGNGSWGRLHHLSFFLWVVVIVIHLASYVPKLPRMLSGRVDDARPCWRAGPRAGSCCAVPWPPASGWRSPPITSRPNLAARTASSPKPGAWPVVWPPGLAASFGRSGAARPAAGFAPAARRGGSTAG
jgi:hypothetical protein